MSIKKWVTGAAVVVAVPATMAAGAAIAMVATDGAAGAPPPRPEGSHSAPVTPAPTQSASPTQQATPAPKPSPTDLPRVSKTGPLERAVDKFSPSGSNDAVKDELTKMLGENFHVKREGQYKWTVIGEHEAPDFVVKAGDKDFVILWTDKNDAKLVHETALKPGEEGLREAVNTAVKDAKVNLFGEGDAM